MDIVGAQIRRAFTIFIEGLSAELELDVLHEDQGQNRGNRSAPRSDLSIITMSTCLLWSKRIKIVPVLGHPLLHNDSSDCPGDIIRSMCRIAGSQIP